MFWLILLAIPLPIIYMARRGGMVFRLERSRNPLSGVPTFVGTSFLYLIGENENKNPAEVRLLPRTVRCGVRNGGRRSGAEAASFLIRRNSEPRPASRRGGANSNGASIGLGSSFLFKSSSAPSLTTSLSKHQRWW